MAENTLNHGCGVWASTTRISGVSGGRAGGKISKSLRGSADIAIVLEES